MHMYACMYVCTGSPRLSHRRHCPPTPLPTDLFGRQVDPWWQLCLTLKRDREANQAFGWVLEMWGWALAAAHAGVKHIVLREFQAEPGGMGIGTLDAYYLYHYTFDLEIPGGWRWSKRVFMGGYPQPIPDPPARRAQRSVHTFVRMMNEAMHAIAPWRPMR